MYRMCTCHRNAAEARGMRRCASLYSETTLRVSPSTGVACAGVRRGVVACAGACLAATLPHACGLWRAPQRAK